MNNSAQTLDQVQEYQKFWDKTQVQLMIDEVDKRNPKSQTTLDCVELLTEMILNVSDVDQTRIFAIVCVLNKGLILSDVDPHCHPPTQIGDEGGDKGGDKGGDEGVQKGDQKGGEKTVDQRDYKNDTNESIFAMNSIDEELMRMLAS